MASLCYRKGYENGAWYEIKCVADIIRMKEARGADASFERDLLKAWSAYPGYESAKGVLESLTNQSITPEKSKSKGSERPTYINPRSDRNNRTKQPDF
jgi:hypothetical protein